MGGMSEGVIVALMGSSVIVALITLLSSVINFKLNRKATLEDKKLAKSDKVAELQRRVEELENNYKKLNTDISKVQSSVNNITVGLRMIFHDSILKTASQYIKDGKITLHEKSALKSMHSVYHNNLGGNGDLDEVMGLVDDLECTVD